MNALAISDEKLNVDLFAGPGGWSKACQALGITDLGIELDAAACATRAAAGHMTLRADVSMMLASQFAGRLWGLIGSPPCIVFSAAGKRAGVAVTNIIAAAIRDVFAGLKTRARRRGEMVKTLRASAWLGDTRWVPPPSPGEKGHQQWQRQLKARLLARRDSPAAKTRDMADMPYFPHPTRAARSARIWDAVRSASLVIEPARFIYECRPEWVALEQVPAVLPLWEVYAGELRRMGYSAWAGKINAADYGVPQTRERAILIASRVRRVARPEPTHYDPRKGDQLWGTPWVSMADALGWGASGRPAVSVTAGGTSTGGAEPFAKSGRAALEAERDAGRWALRIDAQANASVRPATAPAPTIKSGHSAAEMQWILHTNRGQEADGSRQTVDPSRAPAPALTGKSGGQWVMQRQVGATRAEGRRDHELDEPAPTITGGGSAAGSGNGAGLVWKFRNNNNNNNNACERSLDEPAGTLFFGGRSNWAAWTAERPATTVQGDPRIGRPGHKDREGGESQFAQDSVRISVQEAAVLQSFPADYPWQGTKTAQFTQVGNAWCPLAAIHVLGMATGIDSRDVAERYMKTVYGTTGEAA